MQSSSRNGATVRCLAIHTTEGILRATQLRDWAAWAGSSHASCDETGALLEGAAGGFVDYARAAWTIRNGNSWTDNLEICGWARWTRAEWLSRPKLLEAVARWLAGRHLARGIPLGHLSVAALRAGHRGVIDHDDYTDATGDGTHWDVGESFPWDVVLPHAVALAGTSRPPATPKRRRRRVIGYIVRSTETGGTFLATDRGLIHLRTAEEVNVAGWLLDDTRAANATLNQGGRFMAICQEILSRDPFVAAIRKTSGAPAGLFAAGATATQVLRDVLERAEAPAPAGDEDPADAIAPPPGMDLFVSDAPGHD